MQKIREIKNQPPSPDLVFMIHRQVTNQTLEDASGAGRFRQNEEKITFSNDEGEIYHVPPSADELATRMQAMCAFPNGQTPEFFVHPVVRAIIIHFWLAYDHPFIDGNGRTARSLFYWAMLHRGYWLFEYISISSILRRSQAKYLRSFLYTETDDNDLTYFIVAQAEVINEAIEQLHAYVKKNQLKLIN